MQTQASLEGAFDDVESEEIYTEYSSEYVEPSGQVIEQRDGYTIYENSDGTYIVEDVEGWQTFNSYEEASQFIDNWTAKGEAEQNGEDMSGHYYNDMGEEISREEWNSLYSGVYGYYYDENGNEVYE